MSCPFKMEADAPFCMRVRQMEFKADGTVPLLGIRSA